LLKVVYKFKMIRIPV